MLAVSCALCTFPILETQMMLMRKPASHTYQLTCYACKVDLQLAETRESQIANGILAYRSSLMPRWSQLLISVRLWNLLAWPTTDDGMSSPMKRDYFCIMCFNTQAKVSSSVILLKSKWINRKLKWSNMQWRLTNITPTRGLCLICMCVHEHNFSAECTHKQLTRHFCSVITRQASVDRGLCWRHLLCLRPQAYPVRDEGGGFHSGFLTGLPPQINTPHDVIPTLLL